MTHNPLNITTPRFLDDAACATIDPEAFFPPAGDSGHRAKTICNTYCPIKDQCLQWALGIESENGGYRSGIYGGKSPRERARILNRTCNTDGCDEPVFGKGYRYCKPHSDLRPCNTNRTRGVAA